MNLDKNERMVKFSDCCLKNDLLIIKDLQGILRRNSPLKIEVKGHRVPSYCHEGGVASSYISEYHVDWVISKGWFSNIIKYKTTSMNSIWYVKKGQLRINLQKMSVEESLHEINDWVEGNLIRFNREYDIKVNEIKKTNDMLAANKELLRNNGVCEYKNSKWRFW